jgi:hypothetical protein
MGFGLDEMRHDPQALHPLRTFSIANVAFHLNQIPSFKQMSVNDVVEKFGLPDLCPALADFMHRYAPGDSITYAIGGRRRVAVPNDFNGAKVQVWSSVRMQSKSYHDVTEVMPAQIVNACPPCDDWPLGRYDGVIVNVDSSKSWPRSALDGRWIVADCYNTECWF